MKQEFTVHGTPKAQGRPRFARMGKFVKTYETKEDTQHKDNLRAQLVNLKPVYIGSEPVILTVRFFLPRPKSHLNTKGECKKSAPTSHCQKPDIDNMMKAVMDAMKGIVWHDDSQVFMISTVKLWTRSAPYTDIIVESIDDKETVMDKELGR